jgi:hypothetical protein
MAKRKINSVWIEVFREREREREGFGFQFLV